MYVKTIKKLNNKGRPNSGHGFLTTVEIKGYLNGVLHTTINCYGVLRLQFYSANNAVAILHSSG